MVDLSAFLRSPRLMAWGAFVAAAVVSLLIAFGAAMLLERVSARAVKTALANEGIAWVEIEPDGEVVWLRGTAPTEATRFRVLNIAARVVENSRIRDRMEVEPPKAVEAPRFSVEMLRNDDGIQLIGLLPEGPDKEALEQAATALQPDIPLQDMLETAAYEPPETWAPALDYGMEALRLLSRSKISVAAGEVTITAIAGSEGEKRDLETQLAADVPEGLSVKVEISAPRPVITPFTLRFVADKGGLRFDACSADTDKARDRILAAATKAGVTGRVACTVGLGVPSPSWGQAAEAGIAAVAALKDATITFRDADVTLEAGAGVSTEEFDRVVGELEAALPEVFALDAKQEKAAEAAQGPAQFTANLNPDTGRVELRGRLTDEALRKVVDSYATALFGTGKVYLATRMDAGLPDGWPERVLAGLEALAELKSGNLVVRADMVLVSGVTGSQVARARVSQILAARLGKGASFKVEVTYDEALDPIASVPTPQECVEKVGAVLKTGKITFQPSSSEIDAASNAVIDRIAAVLKTCPGTAMEIGGHTDAQGSDTGNQTLSQARAEAVLLALQGRQVEVGALIAKGYGESVPVADNDSEEGREANRRIEFRLIGAPAAPADQPATRATGAGQAAGDDPATARWGDTPSNAPAEKTLRPKPRPKKAD